MQLRGLVILLASTMITAPALACKCIMRGQNVISATKWCCELSDGEFQYGEDCKASSISENLDRFSTCCIASEKTDKSDCPW